MWRNTPSGKQVRAAPQVTSSDDRRTLAPMFSPDWKTAVVKEEIYAFPSARVEESADIGCICKSSKVCMVQNKALAIFLLNPLFRNFGLRVNSEVHYL